MCFVVVMFDEMVEVIGKFVKKVDEGCEDVNMGVLKYFIFFVVSFVNIFLFFSLNLFW